MLEEEMDVTSVHDMTPPMGDAAATVVAGSLSTVGYAMFALLNSGPLTTIPSMPDFVERIRLDEATAALPVDQTFAHPEYVGDPEDGAFGTADVGENLGALTPPQAPYEAPALSTPTHSGTPDYVPADEPAPQPHPENDEQGEGYPQPKNPLGSVPEYTGNTTLAMLQEISFLDE